jgi:hypothetical protein
MMDRCGNGFQIGPKWSEVVSADIEASKASVANENTKPPQGNMAWAIVDSVTRRSGGAFAAFSVTTKAELKQQISIRTANVTAPAPKLLADQRFRKFPNALRLTPPASNSSSSL